MIKERGLHEVSEAEMARRCTLRVPVTYAPVDSHGNLGETTRSYATREDAEAEGERSIPVVSTRDRGYIQRASPKEISQGYSEQFDQYEFNRWLEARRRAGRAQEPAPMRR